MIGPATWRLALLVRLAALAALFAGTAVAVRSPVAVILVAGSAALACAAILIARRFRWQETLSRTADAGSDSPRAAEPGGDGLAVSRGFFYLGVVSIGLLVIRPVAGATLSDLSFLLALCAAISVLIVRHRQPDVALPPLILIGTLVFAIGGFLTAFWAESLGDSFGVIARVVYLTTVWFWLGTILLTEPQHLRAAVVWLVVSAGLNGVGALLQSVGQVQIFGAEPIWGRASGFTDHVNQLGGACAFVIAPAMALVHPRAGASFAQRLVVAICLPLIVAGLLLSGSISGALAAALAAGLWVIVSRSYWQALVAVALVGGAIVLLSGSSANPYFRTPVDRLEQSVTRSEGGNATFWSRIEANAVAWDEIQRHPFTGIGLVPEDAVTATGHQVHNMIVKLWFEGGLLAMLGMLAIYGAVGTAGWRAVVRARTDREQTIAIGLLLSYVSLIVWASGQPQLFQRFGWVSGLIILALRAQQIRTSRATAPRRLVGRTGSARIEIAR